MSNDSTVQNVPLDKIKLSTRRRVKYEGIEELAHSIDAGRLIHPILLDLDHTVICGARRYLAFKSLGRETIPAFVDDISEEEAGILELIENRQRENFKDFEDAEALLQLSAKVAETLNLEFRPTVGQKSRGRGGKPDSDERIIEYLAGKGLGIGRHDLQRARKWVKKVKDDPTLRGQSRSKTLKDEQRKPRRVKEPSSVPAVVSTDAIDLSSPVGQVVDQFAEVLAKLERLRRKVCGVLMWTLDQDDPMDVETVERGIDELIQQRDDAISVSTQVQAELEGARATTGKAFTTTTGSKSAEKPAGQWPQFQAGDLCENGRKGKICATTLNPRNHHPACDRF